MTNFTNETCEAALAHVIGNKAEAAYRRGDLFEKRRKLMDLMGRILRYPKKAARSWHSDGSLKGVVLAAREQRMKAKTRGKQSKKISPSFGSASDRQLAVETKSTAFDIVIQRRADRRRKLLPQLGLSYPSDHEVLKIAELAKVDEPAAFGDHLRSIRRHADSNAALFKGLSAPKGSKHPQQYCPPCATACRQLEGG